MYASLAAKHAAAGNCLHKTQCSHRNVRCMHACIANWQCSSGCLEDPAKRQKAWCYNEQQRLADALQMPRKLHIESLASEPSISSIQGKDTWKTNSQKQKKHAPLPNFDKKQKKHAPLPRSNKPLFIDNQVVCNGAPLRLLWIFQGACGLEDNGAHTAHHCQGKQNALWWPSSINDNIKGLHACMHDVLAMMRNQEDILWWSSCIKDKSTACRYTAFAAVCGCQWRIKVLYNIRYAETISY